MKKIILILVVIFFNQNTANAQAPINVVITGDCVDVSGTYSYTGLVNGKNNYAQTFNFGGTPIVIGVGYDGVKWVLYADGDLTDDGFSNSAVPAGLLPPFTGWVHTGCADGTMVINQTLSSNDVDNFDKNISLYPNPSTNTIIIANNKGMNDVFNYKILDLTGRIVSYGTSRYDEKINIDNITNGNYIVEIKTQDDQAVSKRLIKK
ncbi:T9SS type A sorting domain-containing protein [Flavobacterium sp.]|uniref:T9SS type A sorting domain-containing protein n=1 Tax=Flavobacterium sp. TaxID=239 RepID=UPI0037526E96